VGVARGLVSGVGTEGGWSAVGVREVPEGLMGLTHWGAKWMDIWEVSSWLELGRRLYGGSK
jgi:hypothetical protein